MTVLGLLHLKHFVTYFFMLHFFPSIAFYLSADFENTWVGGWARKLDSHMMEIVTHMVRPN